MSRTARGSAGPNPAGPALRFLVGRLLGGAAVLLVVSFALFALIYAAPGGAEQALAGPYASAEQRQAIRETYHLDDPLLTQYGHYLRSLATLDFGASFLMREPVTVSLARAAMVTLPLLLSAWGLAMIGGIALGLLAATRRGGAVDRWVSSTVVVAASTPMFATAILLTWLFGVKLGWLPTVGSGQGGIDTLRHLVLPAVAMGTVLLASATRVTRSAVMDVLDSDHVTFARSRGISSRRILGNDVLRNAAVPIVTQAGGLLIALTGGLVVVESVFAFDGIGSLLTQAIGARDVPVIQAVTLALAAAIVLINLAVDLAIFGLDPRVRRGRGRG
ncbi:ABC transporter permease [Acrocarpospora catenulata]|uniref:ABC transporter permease n=1 Tax=Acrocarpospora catenulata TaxID=2836182 RepID=UPI001BD9C20D|nr:ABC transporter permease [Acrocarpospora catenulata]